MAFTQQPTSVVLTDRNGFEINLGAGSGPFTQAPLSVTVTDKNGNSVSVGSGSPTVAVVDLTAQAASISPTTLYTVPALAGGMYRVSAHAVVTQAATTSSTLPVAAVQFTDKDTSVLSGAISLTNINSANTVGATGVGAGGTGFLGSATFSAKAGTTINYSTGGYASSGATPMQYAIHYKLEYLG